MKNNKPNPKMTNIKRTNPKLNTPTPKNNQNKPNHQKTQPNPQKNPNKQPPTNPELNFVYTMFFS